MTKKERIRAHFILKKFLKEETFGEALPSKTFYVQNQPGFTRSISLFYLFRFASFRDFTVSESPR